MRRTRGRLPIEPLIGVDVLFGLFRSRFTVQGTRNEVAQGVSDASGELVPTGRVTTLARVGHVRDVGARLATLQRISGRLVVGAESVRVFAIFRHDNSPWRSWSVAGRRYSVLEGTGRAGESPARTVKGSVGHVDGVGVVRRRGWERGRCALARTAVCKP